MGESEAIVANNADNTAIVPDGIIYFGPENGPAPDSSAWTAGPEYDEVGYYSEDGYTLTPNAGSETALVAHNKDEVQSFTDTNGNWTLGFGPIETKKSVVERYFDADVNLSEGSITVARATTQRRYSIVAVALPKDGRRIVKYFPSVKISDREPITYNATTLLAYGMTFQTRVSQSLLDADGKPSQFKIFDPLFLNS